MGTRALISKDGKPIIATHWDGYPVGGLGDDLRNMPNLTMEAVIAVADGHSIDFIDIDLGKIVKENRIQKLMVKHNLSRAEIIEGKRRGNVISNDDYEIGDIKIYADWAEWQYDIRDNSIYYRTLSGAWDGGRDKNQDEWILLKIF